jgi:hypothetical protein
MGQMSMEVVAVARFVAAGRGGGAGGCGPRWNGSFEDRKNIDFRPTANGRGASAIIRMMRASRHGREPTFGSL